MSIKGLGKIVRNILEWYEIGGGVESQENIRDARSDSTSETVCILFAAMRVVARPSFSTRLARVPCACYQGPVAAGKYYR